MEHYIYIMHSHAHTHTSYVCMYMHKHHIKEKLNCFQKHIMLRYPSNGHVVSI